MKPPYFIILLIGLAGPPAVFAQTPALTYVPGSSVKLYQVTGDCDWVEWDATINNKTPTCKQTASQTLSRADVMGDDVPVVFENNGEMILTFGDTIGASPFAPWSDVTNSFVWGAHDPIARSTTAKASDGLVLNYFLNGNHGLEILPPPQPNGTAVDMGADNIPRAGVSINGTIYLGVKTGSSALGGGNVDNSKDYSILASFNESTLGFTSGRTLSSSPAGHFMGPAFYLAPAGTLGTPAPVSPEPTVLIYGVGTYQASNIYLSIIPSSEFWTGVDQSGNPATRYFAGTVNGQPTWSTSESAAVPVVNDVDPTNPTVVNVSVIYSPQLGLWLMTFDGGRNSESKKGAYFTYAPKPWGPWSTPQLIFNNCRDKGWGNFIFYYYATAPENTCPGLANSSGPAGPTIGDQTANNPNTTKGTMYGPAMVERFTTISGSTLKIFYLMATWNPYATVMMESDFNIAYGPAILQVANAEGESPAIAPNTWVEVKGANLAPANDMRIWQASDFVGGRMPTMLDGVSVTVNGRNAYVYYISPAQIDILTPPDAMNGAVQVAVTNKGAASPSFTAQAQSLSPSLFVFNGGPYAAAVHSNGSLIGPATLYPGFTTPAQPGETVMIYANGFGPTSVPILSGSVTQSGTLSPLPVVEIGGVRAVVQFAGLVATGEFQFNVVIPPSLGNSDQSITATYGGATTQAGAMITVHN